MFAELGRVRGQAEQEGIREHVLEQPLPDIDRVVAYLRAGHVLIDFMDVQDDVFDSSRQVLGGPTVLTDGEWLWRDDLAYYAGRHNVALPGEFLARIRRCGYVVPEVDEPTLERLTDDAHNLVF
ncbi:hypothetical protein GCM10020358_66550 [Amorphoplanes nipponensis]|uniref:Uncharacterized protein n=2 Tax=Actinoplanes nipponensis TaxID=135950 RepID=A0A919MRN2_9ACTN|nr:hypothetical protein Ani05nite_53020 [Actinoplanes nipponensis]